jgi:HK97 gp10 family phage protein
MADDGGLSRFPRRLAAIPTAVKQAVQPALIKSGDELVGLMRQLAPEETGKLKASIVATPAGQSTPPYSQPGGSQVVPENAVVITAGNATTRYSHLVEYGTTLAPAQPYFWPSYRLLKKRLANRIKRAMSKAVRERWTA